MTNSYLSRYRDKELSLAIAKQISDKASDLRKIKIMHFCGTHEYTVSYYGLRSLIPRNIELIPGPGCPVCVAAVRDIDEAIWLAENKNVTLTTFGDMVRVPASNKSLWEAKSWGADVRVVYSPHDAVKIAEDSPEKQVVFFAVGFETTAPAVAYEILKSRRRNLSFLTSLRLTPPIMKHLLESGDIEINGIIAPGHVSTVIGYEPWKFAVNYNVPIVVAGFEPVDVLMAILMIVNQIRRGEVKLENEYKRSVTEKGNIKAKEIMGKVFEETETTWRGIGKVPFSGYKIREEYSYLDSRRKHEIKVETMVEEMPRGCICDKVVLGKAYPTQCPLFNRKCTPKRPIGPCMVSIEGTCHIWYRFGKQLV